MKQSSESLILIIHRDLADIRKGGQLTKEEFAVAMFLINNKLAGKELPTALEQSMIPPNLRNSSGPAVPPQSQLLIESDTRVDLTHR
jgi:hypothetical protein